MFRIIFIMIITVVVPHVCVSVRSFLPPHASTSRNIGTYVFTVTRKTLFIESVDSISKDERGFPLTQYITNGRISRDGYTFTHFKHHHRVPLLISYSMSV